MRARLLGIALILTCLAVGCGSDVPPSPTPVEWYDLGAATDLSGLQSYRTRYAFRWQDAAQASTTSWDVLIEWVHHPPARHVLWSVETEQGPGAPVTAEYIQLGAQAWVRVDNDWLPVTGGDANIFGASEFLSEPLSILSGTQGRLVQRRVTINTLTADRYAYDEETIGPAQARSVTRAEGDVWVSADHSVIVKFEAHYEGGNLIDGYPDPGVLDVAFDLTDINEPIEITSPQDAPPASASDIPLPDNAVGVVVFAGIVELKSDSTQAELAAFFETQMPLKGWQQVESVGTSLLTFSKGTRTVQILIEPLEHQAGVTIMFTD